MNKDNTIRYYTNITSATGPIIIVDGVEGVGYDEFVEITEKNGERRYGKVLEVSGSVAAVQLFSSTIGLEIETAKVRFTGEGLKLNISTDILGRVFSGIGKPIDGKPEIIGGKKIDINGLNINPTARDYPNLFIQTGISAIDGLNTLVRGQKLPIFSGAGLPHINLTTQIVRQAKVTKGINADDKKKEPPFAIVFAGLGISHDEAEFYTSAFRNEGALSRSVVFLNLASDPTLERVATPRLALTAAEYLAFEQGFHVLVIMTDMTNYGESLREISAARKEIPGRRGYPSYMYTDFASIYERAGCIKGKPGSVTLLPILTLPEDDKTHPIPDLTGYITEGQIILSRGLHKNGITPPIDVSSSLSRLKDKGIGEGKTRADHASILNQLFASYANGKEVRELAQILGIDALTDLDRMYLHFADEFENRFINQGFDTNRTIIETLDMGWQLLRILPRTELKRISEEHLDEYLSR